MGAHEAKAKCVRARYYYCLAAIQFDFISIRLQYTTSTNFDRKSTKLSGVKMQQFYVRSNIAVVSTPISPLNRLVTYCAHELFGKWAPSWTERVREAIVLLFVPVTHILTVQHYLIEGECSCQCVAHYPIRGRVNCHRCSARGKKKSSDRSAFIAFIIPYIFQKMILTQRPKTRDMCIEIHVTLLRERNSIRGMRVRFELTGVPNFIIVVFFMSLQCYPTFSPPPDRKISYMPRHDAWRERERERARVARIPINTQVS